MSYSAINIKSAGKFLRIESGQPHDIRILTESPHERSLHGFGSDSVECTSPKAPCLKCMDGDEPKQRFSANVFDHSARRVMVWEFGTGIAKQLKAIDVTLQEEKKSILDVDLKVDATGSNKAKKYTVTPRMTSKPIPPDLKLYVLDPGLPF